QPAPEDFHRLAATPRARAAGAGRTCPPTPPVFPGNDRSTVLESHRRTGYLLVAVVLAHVLLISAQVSNRTGASLLETALFGVLSQAQVLSARVAQGVSGFWSEYVALRNARVEAARLHESMDRLGVELQQA